MLSQLPRPHDNINRGEDRLASRNLGDVTVHSTYPALREAGKVPAQGWLTETAKVYEFPECNNCLNLLKVPLSLPNTSKLSTPGSALEGGSKWWVEKHLIRSWSCCVNSALDPESSHLLPLVQTPKSQLQDFICQIGEKWTSFSFPSCIPIYKGLQSSPESLHRFSWDSLTPSLFIEWLLGASTVPGTKATVEQATQFLFA